MHSRDGRLRGMLTKLMGVHQNKHVCMHLFGCAMIGVRFLTGYRLLMPSSDRTGSCVTLGDHTAQS